MERRASSMESRRFWWDTVHSNTVWPNMAAGHCPLQQVTFSFCHFGIVTNQTDWTVQDLFYLPIQAGSILYSCKLKRPPLHPLLPPQMSISGLTMFCRVENFLCSIVEHRNGWKKKHFDWNISTTTEQHLQRQQLTTCSLVFRGHTVHYENCDALQIRRT